MASAECSAEDCNRLVFEAVNRKSVYKFELVKRTYSQIEVLTSLALCNEKGETPLVIAMKGGNVSLIDELVIFLRKCDREVAKCHEMSQIAIDQLFYHLIPIMELLEHLIKKSNDSISVYSKWLDFFAKVAFKATSLSRQDKIIALELIGASLFNHNHCYEEDYYGEDNNPFAVMFWCWREAMTLRYFPAEGEPLLPKIPYVGIQSVASSVVFGSDEEFMTMEELDQMEEDFERADIIVRYGLLNVVRRRWIIRMQRQSLLVIRRISSQANHGHPYLFYLKSLDPFDGRGDDEKPVDNIVRVVRCYDWWFSINTYLLILEQMTGGFDPKLLPYQSFNIFIKSLSIVSHLLACMAREPHRYPGREELTYANLLTATKFIGTIAKYFPNDTLQWFSFSYYSYKSFATIISNLVFVLASESMSHHLNNQQKQELEDFLSYYIQNYFLKRRRTTVLHAGVLDFLEYRKYRTSEYVKHIKLIIKLGADPNAIDENGQTPLQILAGRNMGYVDENVALFQALVDAGTHLDMAVDNRNAAYRKTVIDMLKRFKGRRIVAALPASVAYFRSLISSVFPLSWHCSRVIRRHRIPIDRLPLRLQTSLTD